MKAKIITGEIADQSGHTDFRGTLQEAVTKIMDECKRFGKWAYINGGAPFIFERFDKAEEDALFAALDAAAEPHFTLTPSVEGGLEK